MDNSACPGAMYAHACERVRTCPAHLPHAYLPTSSLRTTRTLREVKEKRRMSGECAPPVFSPPAWDERKKTRPRREARQTR